MKGKEERSEGWVAVTFFSTACLQSFELERAPGLLRVDKTACFCMHKSYLTFKIVFITVSRPFPFSLLKKLAFCVKFSLVWLTLRH